MDAAERTDPVRETTGSGLRVNRVCKSYGTTSVLKNVSLDVPHRAFHALLGPSGSGKTTLLKVVAGFTPADEGTVTLAGRDITWSPPERRNIGVVFQNYALFPHMSVAQNIAFGLRMRGVPRAARIERVREVLRLVRMQGFGQRRPAELSGGQQQRVALARALVIRPALLLLDEPLSALDRKIRQDLREELKRIQSETRVTTIMVTHDQEEALFLADRVSVLDAGVLRQEGAPEEIYHNPVDAFVAGFLGAVNLLDVEIRHGDEGLVVHVGRQSFMPSAELHAGLGSIAAGRARLAVRPEEATVLPVTGSRPADVLEGTLTAAAFAGPIVTLRVAVEGHEMEILALSPDVAAHGVGRKGGRVWVRIRQGRLLGDGEQR